MNKKAHRLLLSILLLFSASLSSAEEIRVAVASNFTHAIQNIARAFEQQSAHTVLLAFGSTGKHYAQIKNGAPFDAFFAADIKRPQLLEEEGIGLAGSRFTYAIGKVALWSPTADRVDPEGQVLKSGDFQFLAMANPKLAPYGKAAEQIMQAHGVWNTLQHQIVRGENIGQTFQFVKSGNAQLGFVAYSQILRPNMPIQGSVWEPPQSLYTPIDQQAIQIKDRPVAREFLDFVRSNTARKIIQSYGYGTP